MGHLTLWSVQFKYSPETTPSLLFTPDATGYKQTSLMVSESEEEIVYDAVKTKKSSRKPPNGIVPQSAHAQQENTPKQT